MNVLDITALTQNAGALGLTLSREQLTQFEIYARLLVEWNQKMNLTAITSPEGIAVLHFADSLSLLAACPDVKGRVLDIGTGAGFPAIPLKIVRPDLDITMMDSLNKRLTFLQEVLDTLGLKGTLLHARAEEKAFEPSLRERFDVVTARAVAALPVLCEYCLPYVKVGGRFIAMKGPSCPEEIQASDNALSLLGGKLQETKVFTLSDGSVRHIAVMEKQKPTPGKYPRAGGKIKKKAL